jgi:hypothetical protein
MDSARLARILSAGSESLHNNWRPVRGQAMDLEKIRIDRGDVRSIIGQ